MNICVFCSARNPLSQSLTEEIQSLCASLAKQGNDIVYGGATVGIMGLAANTFLENGAQAIGVIPSGLFDKEIPHTGLSEFIETEDLMQRKKVMMERSDAVLCLPGGIGTLDELFEVLTWKTLNCWNKPIIIFNQNGFWDSLLVLLSDLETKGVLGSEVMDSLVVLDSAESVRQHFSDLQG